MTKASVMIFEGSVKSTETKLVYEPPVLEDGEVVIENRHRPYSLVTVQVTEWLKDSSGEYPDHITFHDTIHEAIGKVDGKPVLYTVSSATGYDQDEKGIFFVENLDGLIVTHGGLQVFRYNDNGDVYLPYFVDYMEPFDADEFKVEIRANS